MRTDYDRRPGPAQSLAAVRPGRGNHRVPVLPMPPAWTADALCAQTDPEAFFPEKGESNREAKGICARCEVRERCLAYALERPERFGVWGGLSERERRGLRDHRPGRPAAAERRAAA